MFPGRAGDSYGIPVAYSRKGERNLRTKPRNTRGSLRGKVALITGASRGIGLAVAQALAAEGCHLVLTARNLKALERVARDLSRKGIEVLPLGCDVKSSADVQGLISAVKAKFRRLDILINNAGIGHTSASVEQLPIDEWSNVIATNLNGMFLVTHFALPLLRRGGAIVNNLSIAAKQVFPNSSAYNASKHGGLGFSNTLREELRPRGIRVIAVLPGATDTEIWATLWPEAPRAKMMSPDSVADAIVHALTQTPESTVEELVIMPASGTL
jgi:NAD(P)-dependent dehydrogenase (short-subunit alcohol dehydrogenase family)